jgi:hypothetical protein
LLVVWHVRLVRVHEPVDKGLDRDGLKLLASALIDKVLSVLFFCLVQIFDLIVLIEKSEKDEKKKSLLSLTGLRKTYRLISKFSQIIKVSTAPCSSADIVSAIAKQYLPVSRLISSKYWPEMSLAEFQKESNYK